MAVLMHVRYPLSLRNVEDVLHERGIDLTHETVRFWWNRFGTIFAARIRRNRVQSMQAFRHRRWHLDEVFVKINGVHHYLWRAVDHEGEVLASFVTRTRDKKAALKFLRKVPRRNGRIEAIVTDRLASSGAARKTLGAVANAPPAAGSTTGLRTVINRSYDGRGRCSGSGKCEVCRNSPPCTARSTTTSTRTVTSDQHSRPTATQPWPSGGSLVWPEKRQAAANLK